MISSMLGSSGYVKSADWNETYWIQSNSGMVSVFGRRILWIGIAGLSAGEF